MSDTKIFSVNEYLDLINIYLAEVDVVIEGEISSLTRHSSGHLYFSISDDKNKDKAVLSCALWKFKAQQLTFDLKEGEKVQITGKANIYKPSGRFTFQVDKIFPVGEGALKQAFEKLKKDLEAKGYFAPEHKKPLPRYPEKIAVLTSRNGDALNDFRTHLGKFGLDINLLDTRVEGIKAISEIVSGIQYLNQNSTDLDIIVLTRGGGSLESLQAFNSLEVAQAIYASRLPIICAVGHENDVTIADLVADYRASTPTDAARVVTEHWRAAQNTIELSAQLLSSKMMFLLRDLHHILDSSWDNASCTFENHLQMHQEKLTITEEFMYQRGMSQLQTHLQYLRQVSQHFVTQIRWQMKNYQHTETQFMRTVQKLGTKLVTQKEVITDKSAFLDTQGARLVSTYRTRLNASAKQLQASDPTLKLKQGYSLIRNQDNRLLKDVDQLKPGQEVNIQVYNGSAHSIIKTIERTHE